MLELHSVADVQELLRQKVRHDRDQKKISRRVLAQRSTVPEATIKKFEHTGQISLRQFLLLWQTLASLDEFVALTRPRPTVPKTIDEVLRT